MAKGEVGDFGFSTRLREREQIVGIYDLVGYTDLNSIRDLVQAVQMMETELQFEISPNFHWDDRTVGQAEKSTNDILLRSTGDGYVVAFSQSIEVDTALGHLAAIHTRIQGKHAVRLGVNRGKNYVVPDVNERVNILGWGINLAARALQFAEAGQIICTEYVAKPMIATDKDLAKVFTSVGTRTVKTTKMCLYNYYKQGEFGAPLTNSQRKQAKGSR